jgi:hypothetical protein
LDCLSTYVVKLAWIGSRVILEEVALDSRVLDGFAFCFGPAAQDSRGKDKDGLKECSLHRGKKTGSLTMATGDRARKDFHARTVMGGPVSQYKYFYEAQPSEDQLPSSEIMMPYE